MEIHHHSAQRQDDGRRSLHPLENTYNHQSLRHFRMIQSIMNMKNLPYVKQIESKLLAEEMRMKLEDSGSSIAVFGDEEMMITMHARPFHHSGKRHGYNHASPTAFKPPTLDTRNSWRPTHSTSSSEYPHQAHANTTISTTCVGRKDTRTANGRSRQCKIKCRN